MIGVRVLVHDQGGGTRCMGWGCMNGVGVHDRGGGA